MKASSLVITLFSLIVTGCALQPQQNKQAYTPLPEVEYQPGQLNRETLYELIVAEVAGQRKQFELSLANYMHQSRMTGDPVIAKRATYIAQYLQQPEKTLEAAQLWQETEPDNPEPYQISAGLLLRQGDFNAALPLLQKALQHSDQQTLLVIRAQSERLSADELTAYIHLLEQYRKETGTTDTGLFTTLGILYKHHGKLQLAGQRFDQAIASNPKNHEAIYQKAELFRIQQRYPEAISLVEPELNQDSPNQQLYTLYIQALFQNDQSDKAVTQAKQLLQLYPNEPQLGFYIALLLLENENIDDSRLILEQLLQNFPNNTTPHYYLGLIAQREQRDQAAISHFLQVRDNNNILQSFARISGLLDNADDKMQLQSIMLDGRNSLPQISIQLFVAEAEWLNLHDYKDEALNLLDEALQQHKDEINLLYSRAMMLDPQDISLMEQDLRRVIEIDPQNSMAMNALGYSLTIYTERYDEALQLISQALAITPDDPAALDSMGWVLYKLGRTPEAVPYLEKAYDAFPDPEVSSHLIRVYIAAGQLLKARSLLEQELLKHPDNEYLSEAAEAISNSQESAK
ncbi:tetratricopeptide repeat protein [Amphritea sp. HPY]|uniref:tetratricopeptide repeat protein n=1 Tax=Amphritea sp. HPY TaxID=3421652 RepID=UPI003D7DE6DC